jgi:hypothetical protein
VRHETQEGEKCKQNFYLEYLKGRDHLVNMRMILVLKVSIFCSPLKVKRRFRRTCRLHLQGRRKIQAGNQHESMCQIERLRWFLARFILLP